MQATLFLFCNAIQSQLSFFVRPKSWDIRSMAVHLVECAWHNLIDAHSVYGRKTLQSPSAECSWYHCVYKVDMSSTSQTRLIRTCNTVGWWLQLLGARLPWYLTGCAMPPSVSLFRWAYQLITYVCSASCVINPNLQNPSSKLGIDLVKRDSTLLHRIGQGQSLSPRYAEIIGYCDAIGQSRRRSMKDLVERGAVIEGRSQSFLKRKWLPQARAHVISSWCAVVRATHRSEGPTSWLSPRQWGSRRLHLPLVVLGQINRFVKADLKAKGQSRIRTRLPVDSKSLYHYLPAWVLNPLGSNYIAQTTPKLCATAISCTLCRISSASKIEKTTEQFYYTTFSCSVVPVFNRKRWVCSLLSWIERLWWAPPIRQSQPQSKMWRQTWHHRLSSPHMFT